MRRCVLLVAVAACRGHREPTAVTLPPLPRAIAPTADPATWTCDPMPFAASTPVPEASGAAWMTIDGKLVLVVVGDSGTHGAYGLIDPDSGATLEQGKLPLGDAGDDLEGLAARDGKLYGLTSAGWMRVWKREGHGFALVEGPYPIGPVDPSLPRKPGVGDHPPPGNGMVCDAYGVNCGRNYEGLCLRPLGPGGVNPLLCTGWAASKADGKLYCLTMLNEPHDVALPSGEGLAVEHPALQIARPGTLADCGYADDGSLWVGDNLLGMAEVRRIEHDLDPAHATVTAIGHLGIGFPEVIAVRDDVVYRMSDLGGSPSLMAKFRCRPPTR